MGSFDFRHGCIDADTVDVIALDGDLDAYGAPRLRTLLTKLITGGSKLIVLDCSSLRHVDSSGLGALVSALKQISDNSGTLAMAQINDDVKRVLQITGLDRLIPLFADVDEARAAHVLQAV